MKASYQVIITYQQVTARHIYWSETYLNCKPLLVTFREVAVYKCRDL